MDRLPSDVILLIVHQLAVQDPLSLVRATCALALFYRTAAENPTIWREALFGLPEQDLKYTALDEEVELLGGYKKLSIRQCQEEQKQKKGDNASDTPNGRFLLSSYLGKILVLVRVHRELISWGFSDRQHRLTCSESPTFDGWIRLQLLYPVNALKGALDNPFKSIDDWRSYFTVEVYTWDWRQGPKELVPSCTTFKIDEQNELVYHWLTPVLPKDVHGRVLKVFLNWGLAFRAIPNPEFWWKVIN